MKKTILFIGLNLIFISAFGQIADSVLLGPSYANQSYYNFNTGEVANVDNNNWDIAFATGGMGSSIRINGQAGTMLYVYPNGDTTDWTNLDTNGMSSSWTALNNSDKSWSLGAFDQNADPNNSFDLGWGTYSMITHHITGDSLHVIKLSDGSYRKLQMIKLASGTYNFKFANIDGSNETVASVAKSSFTDKNFGYYSIQTGTEIDREPLSQDWSIVFTKYVTEIMPGMTYGVTGVLSNNGYSVAKASGVDLTNVDHNAFTFETDINTIGYNWKSFNMTSFSYDLQDSLCYFVKNDANGEIWKIYFNAFQGSSTGKIVFNKELIGGASLFENPQSSLTLYPNPSTDKIISVLYEVKNNAVASIFDMNGNMVHSFELNQNGFSKMDLNLSHLNSGAYFISFQDGNRFVKEKLILQ